MHHSPLANAQSITLARFRRRHEAEAHLRALKQLLPGSYYEIIFDTATTQDD